MTAQPTTIDGFEALAQGLTWLEAAFERVRAANSSRTYLPNSPADHEIATAGRWGATSVRNAHVDGVLPLFSAGDHLTTLADVLRRPGGIFASYTIARGALEASAKTWYLMEPNIGPQERARRRVNERLDSLYSQVLLLEGMGEKAPEQREQIDGLLDGARQQGYYVKAGKNYRSPYVHEEQPKHMALLGEMMRTAEDGIDVGGTTYRLMSGVAHGVMYGLVQLIEPMGPAPEPGVRQGRVRQDSRTTASHLMAVPLAYALAVGRVIDDYGWDSTGWAEPMVAALTRWRDHANLPG